MKKKAKLFQAFLGDAVGLRDVLVEHFKEAAAGPIVTGETYEAGFSRGRQAAYRDAFQFLKKIVINGDEHVEDEPAKEGNKMNDVIPVHGLVPQSMTEAMKLADLMAGARLVPSGLQNSPADCLLVIEQAIRWQMSPFAVAQEASVIQGKLMYSGKLVAAVINSRGNLQDRLSYSYDGEGDLRTVTVAGRLQGELEPRTVRVKIRDARTANKVWEKQPDQQLAYHGARVWARRHTPELMLGVWAPEEFEPQPLRASAKLPPRPAPNVLLHDPETGEIEDPSQATSAGPDLAREGAPGSSETEEITTPPDQGEPGVAFMIAARQAARLGRPELRKFYLKCNPEQQEMLGGEMKDELEALLPDK